MNSGAVCSEIPSRAEIELSVCSRLLRAISHMIRGDLSVVTNDLTYLCSMVPPEELERPRERCASAAATLAKVNIITSGVTLDGITLPAFVQEFGGSSDADSVVLRGDRSKLFWIGQTLRALLGVIAFRGATYAPSEDIVITCAVTRTRFVKPHSRLSVPASFETISDYAIRALGEREIVEAALADLVFQAFGWRVGLDVNDEEVLLRFRAPREERGR